MVFSGSGRAMEVGPTSTREINTGTEMEHKNRGACSNYGSHCDAEDNLPPTATSACQSAQPTLASTLTWGF